MDQDKIEQCNDSIKALERLYKEYVSSSFPRIEMINDLISQNDEFTDIEIDLADEDAYLAGLVKTFLVKRRLEENEIRIDSSIDTRLESVVKALKGSKESLQRFIEYRKKMLSLANMLSIVSGIPISQ